MKQSELQAGFEKLNISHEFRWALKFAEEHIKTKDLDDKTLTVESLLEDILSRRSSGEPLAYIFGEWPFWNLNLSVRPGVLIPRPETEELAEGMVKRISAKAKAFSHWNIVDFGSGSGCLGLAIASELVSQNILLPGQLDIYLVEASVEACETLKENILRVEVAIPGLKGRMHLEEKSWMEWSPPQPLQAIVSNPPYISGAELESPLAGGLSGESINDEADADVKSFEPKMALYPNDLEKFPDASGPYRQLLKLSSMMLDIGGIAGFELGIAQMPWIKNFTFENFPTLRGELLKDMSGKDRFFNFERVL